MQLFDFVKLIQKAILETARDQSACNRRHGRKKSLRENKFT